MNTNPQATTAPAIGREQILQARQTLERYRSGKANLERRIIENEQWFKLRHWECMRKGAGEQVEPASGWLFNAIANKHADAMDNFPSPAILPREAADQPEAEALSAIVPVVLEQNEFEEVYDRVWDSKLRSGTGIYGIFWDQRKLGGLGDISIRKVDIVNLFWESGITDIQESKNLFHVELVDNEALLESYPWLEPHLEADGGQLVSRYLYDDTVDTTGKSALVDWYYKKRQKGRQVLHYCKFVADQVLFATENQTEPVPDALGNPVKAPLAETGWYDHGLYPFVFDPMFRVEGTPCGFGYIDIGKSAQEYIDRGNQAILQNLLANTRPRHFIRSDGSVNEEEYADMTRDFVHVDGNLGQDSILPIQGKPLSSIYVQILHDKIDELKEVTGNRDISTGGTSSGVTAASAIAAMQEAGSKLSRDGSRASYRAFRKVVTMVIELMRQFYDLPRCFRILGTDGAVRFVEYSNGGLRREGLPVFDVQICAQRRSPYSRLSQNELALQFYGAGFFDPRMAEQALLCLEMMDFDRKAMVMERIARNGGMHQQIAALAAAVADIPGDNAGRRLAAAGGGQGPQKTRTQYGGNGDIPGPTGNAAAGKGASFAPGKLTALGGETVRGETAATKRARQRVAASTDPT